MAVKQKLTIKEQKNLKPHFIKMLKDNLGILSPVFKTSGVSRYYYEKWMKEDEEFNKKINAVEEHTLDFVESKLYKLIGEGDKTAIIFYLKCKGKTRGYIEKQYIEQENSYKEPLKLNIVIPQQMIEGTETKKIDK